MAKINFTQDQIDYIIQERRNGKAIQKIADSMGRTYLPIQRILKEYGISTRHINYASEEQKEKAIELYQQGYPTRAAAEKIGKSQTVVVDALKKFGIEARSQGYYRWERKYTLDETVFDEINTEEKAYVLGLLLSDGNLGYYPEVSVYRIGLGFKITDTYLLEEVKRIIGSNHPLRHREARENIEICRNIVNSQEFAALYVTSKRMCENLIKVGCPPRKSNTLLFPNERVIDKELIPAMIKGIWEGDGWISEKWGRQWMSGIGVCSGSRLFINQLAANLYYLFDIEGCVIYEKQKEMWKMEVRKQEEVKKFYNLIYSTNTPSMKRKLIEFDKFIEKRKERDKRAEEEKRYKFFDDIEYKRCWICKEFKTLVCFGKNRYKQRNLADECYECKRIKDKEYHDRKREEKPKVPTVTVNGKEMKIGNRFSLINGVVHKRCYKCKAFKELNQFNKNRKKEDGLASDCRDCNKAYLKTYIQTK